MLRNESREDPQHAVNELATGSDRVSRKINVNKIKAKAVKKDHRANKEKVREEELEK